VEAVDGAAEAASGDGVVAVDVRLEPGARMGPPTARRHAAGVVVAVGPTAAVARARAEEAAGRIRVVMRPSPRRDAVAAQ
jgi:hypothetical protein